MAIINMDALLGRALKGKAGEVAAGSLNFNAPVLLYFSASWCPPCRQFTPVLEQLYTQVNAGGKQFEVIYVSWDQTIEQYNDYYSHMSWLAVPFENSSIKDALFQRYGVNGVPCLVQVDRAGNAVCKDCRKEVMTSGPGAVQLWQSRVN